MDPETINHTLAEWSGSHSVEIALTYPDSPAAPFVATIPAFALTGEGQTADLAIDAVIDKLLRYVENRVRAGRSLPADAESPPDARNSASDG